MRTIRQKEFLFVGGSLDGQRGVLPEAPEVYRVCVHKDMIVGPVDLVDTIPDSAMEEHYILTRGAPGAPGEFCYRHAEFSRATAERGGA